RSISPTTWKRHTAGCPMRRRGGAWRRTWMRCRGNPPWPPFVKGGNVLHTAPSPLAGEGLAERAPEAATSLNQTARAQIPHQIDHSEAPRRDLVAIVHAVGQRAER